MFVSPPSPPRERCNADASCHFVVCCNAAKHNDAETCANCVAPPYATRMVATQRTQLFQDNTTARFSWPVCVNDVCQLATSNPAMQACRWQAHTAA
jgi:hypothetical protein